MTEVYLAAHRRAPQVTVCGCCTSGHHRQHCLVPRLQRKIWVALRDTPQGDVSPLLQGASC